MSKKLHVYKARMGQIFVFYVIQGIFNVYISPQGDDSKWEIDIFSSQQGNTGLPQSSLLELLVITGITQEQVLRKIEEYNNLRTKRVARWKW